MDYIETEKVELKRALNNSFEKEVVAFLNSHDGIIYIGVENDGTIIGVNNVDKLMKEISDVITDKILPDCKNYVYPSAIYEDGRMIIKVEVNKGKSLYYIKKYGRSSSGCYIRIGTTCKSMSEEEIEKGYINTLNIPKYSLIEEVSPRQDLTFRIMKIYLDTYNVNYNEENFEINNHLLTENGKYNYLAFILSDQNDLSYKIAEWEGSNKKSKFLYKKEFGNCSVLKVIDDLNSYIQSTHNIVRSFFDEGIITRRDEYLIDQESFREGWINACLHNDYSRHLGPAVYLFSDHLEIFSYGSPLSVQTKKEFLKGVSVPINPELTSIFMKIDKTEASGKGINTIVENYGIEVFEFSESYLSIKMPYNKKVLNSINFHSGENVGVKMNENVGVKMNENVGVKVNENVGVKVNEIQKMIYSFIRNDSKITYAELSKYTNKSEETIRRNIKKLVNMKLIERVGSDKNGQWKIKDK